MISPARAHLERTLASAAAGANVLAGLAPPMPEHGAVASEYGKLLIGLGEDLRQLKSLQSVERKIESKRNMIGRYLPWVTGALEAARENGAAAQDEIVSTMMVWAIDVGDWPLALDLATHVLNHGVALPERYRRQPAVLIAEEVAGAGTRNPPAVDLDTLLQVEQLTAAFDMPDQVRAKLMKAIGLAFKAKVDAFDGEAESAPAGGKAALVAAAHRHLARAMALDRTSGVKKAVDTLQRELTRMAGPATHAGEHETSPGAETGDGTDTTT